MRKFWAPLGLCLALGGAPLAAEAAEFETIDLPATYRTFGSASTPDSGTLFVTATSGVILVYDVDEDRYVASIPLSGQMVSPSAAVVARGKLYVQGFRKIGVVDVETLELERTIPITPYLGTAFGAVVRSASGHRVYAACGSSTDVTVVNTGNDEVVARIPIGGNFTGMGISPDGNRLYVGNKDENELVIVDTQRLEVVRTVPYYRNHDSVDYSTDVHVHPTDGTVYVAYVDEAGIGRVSVLSPEGDFLRGYDIGRFSTGVTVTADGRYLVLGCGLILDPTTGETLGEFDTYGAGLSEISVSPDGMRAYVCNGNDQFVTAVQGFEPPLAIDGVPSSAGSLDVSLDLPDEPGRLYQIGASLGTETGIELHDGRVIPTDLDALLRFSLREDNGVFLGFAGTLDGNGRATATIDLSRDFPGRAIGTTIHVCGVTLETKLSRSDVRRISNVVSFTLTD